MKKILTTAFATIMCVAILSLVGCGNPTWNGYGNGAGKYVPEPNVEYEVTNSIEWLEVEIINVTDEYFYNYVKKCKKKGFVGDFEIDTSNTWWLVFSGEHKDGVYLSITYYDETMSIYVQKY